MEIFKDIPDYEGLYQISDLCRVKSLSRKMWNGKVFWQSKEIILKQAIHKNGYYQVTLSKKGKISTKQVHVICAITFLNHIQNNFKGLIVDHKDNNKSNNRLSNLQLITNRVNCSKDKWRYNSSSKYIGVYRCTKTYKWKAAIRINGKSTHLGYFTNELEASNAYKLAVKNTLLLVLSITMLLV